MTDDVMDEAERLRDLCATLYEENKRLGERIEKLEEEIEEWKRLLRKSS